MNKFAIVGCEASGKTVFMSALCDCFREAIVPENAAANRFARFAARQLRALREWPPATPPGKAVELNFTLREKGRPLAELGLLEFGGETFRAAFREDESESAHKRAVHDLLAFLGDADFILVLASLKELFRDPGATPLEEFERDTESIWVTRGLLEFIRKKAPTASVVIGLTQADRYRRELEAGGGAERVLAARWPSIHQLTNGIPVLPIASVSGTDAEGRPAEGFSTDGILPVLREYAHSQFGTPSLARPATLSAGTLKRHKDAIRAHRAIALLAKQPLGSDVLAAEAQLPELERQLKELRAQAPKKRTKSKARGTGRRTRRVFYLALLLASVILFADQYYPWEKVEVEGRGREKVGVEGQRSEVQGQTEDDNIHSSTSTTNFNSTTLPPLTATTNAPDYRVWHDHKGKAIEARWIATSPDQKSVTLETRKGRHIRAVLYKLSEADRAFILDALKRRE